ncbi:hypothetical protein CPB84DRAFT_1755602 [Gymnopilus junonius]|uniref:Uncharacterized protein n=1 Tax=Gymnopilus junonius TaxID=109634 RepID=A0A9P5TEH1_GYMJU|nr:hypothetical protein CPB84DRAFT_1755602 [Gymnopilus junonius]
MPAIPLCKCLLRGAFVYAKHLQELRHCMWKSSDSSTSGSDTEMEVDPQNLHNPKADDSEVSSLSSLSSLDSLDSLSDLDEDDDPLAPPMDLDDVEGMSADEDSEEEAQLSFALPVLLVAELVAAFLLHNYVV